MEFLNVTDMVVQHCKLSNKYAVFVSLYLDKDDKNKCDFDAVKKYLGDKEYDSLCNTGFGIYTFNKEEDMKSFYHEKFSDGNQLADTEVNPKKGFPRIFSYTVDNNGRICTDNA